MRKAFSGFRVVNVTNGDDGDDGDNGDDGDKYDFLFSISGSAKGIIVILAFSHLVLRLYF